MRGGDFVAFAPDAALSGVSGSILEGIDEILTVTCLGPRHRWGLS
jgi:hypothetical protein